MVKKDFNHTFYIINISLSVVKRWKLFFIIIQKIMWRNCDMRNREMGV